MMGLVCGIPGLVAAGVWWGTWIGKRVFVEVPTIRGRELIATAPRTDRTAPAGTATTVAPQSRYRRWRRAVADEPSHRGR